VNITTDLCFTATLKKKVSSFRSSFARELREEKICSKSGSGKRVSQVYVYARQLSFLRPHMKIRAMTDNANTHKKTEVKVFSNQHVMQWSLQSLS